MVNLEFLTIYTGIDESNHGHDNEIYTSVFSTNPKDVVQGSYEKSTDPVKEGESKKQRIERKINTIENYSFLILQNELKKQIPPVKLIGIIIASLLQDLPKEEYSKDFEKLNIFLDGEWRSTEKIYIKERTAEVLEIKKEVITITCGARYDQKIKLVNLADNLAHYLFRYKTLEELEENKNLKKIIF